MVTKGVRVGCHWFTGHHLWALQGAIPSSNVPEWLQWGKLIYQKDSTWLHWLGGYSMNGCGYWFLSIRCLWSTTSALVCSHLSVNSNCSQNVDLLQNDLRNWLNSSTKTGNKQFHFKVLKSAFLTGRMRPMKLVSWRKYTWRISWIDNWREDWKSRLCQIN